MKYLYYTDGACKGNGKENSYGAWGFILFDEENNELARDCQSEIQTTNQRQELKAIIKACEHALQYDDGFTDIYIYSDSAYAMNCYSQHWYVNWQTNGWINSKKEPVVNDDLWRLLIPYFGKANYHFIKVKGHSNNYKNNLVDEMVQSKAANLRGKYN